MVATVFAHLSERCGDDPVVPDAKFGLALAVARLAARMLGGSRHPRVPVAIAQALSPISHSRSPQPRSGRCH